MTRLRSFLGMKRIKAMGHKPFYRRKGAKNKNMDNVLGVVPRIVGPLRGFQQRSSAGLEIFPCTYSLTSSTADFKREGSHEKDKGKGL
jgi:hypothetical protein